MLKTVEYLEIKKELLKELENSKLSEDRRQVILETLEVIDMNIKMAYVA